MVVFWRQFTVSPFSIKINWFFNIVLVIIITIIIITVVVFDIIIIIIKIIIIINLVNCFMEKQNI